MGRRIIYSTVRRRLANRAARLLNLIALIPRFYNVGTAYVALGLWYNPIMNYQFPPDIEERVKARMSAGRYQSEDELLREAMDALDQLEQDKLTRWDERNRMSMQQSQQGLSRPLDDEAVLGRLRERLAKEGIVD